MKRREYYGTERVNMTILKGGKSAIEVSYDVWDEWSILEKTKGKMWGDDITLDIKVGAADINV